MAAPARSLVQRLPSGRHGLTREAVVQSQRERMLAAMIEAVADKGYADTTVADVIAGAGVSRATFYQQFRDKEDCFLEAWQAVVDGLISRVERSYRHGTEWPERVRAGLGTFLRGLAAEPEAARVSMVEVAAAGPQAHQRYRDAVTSFIRFFEEGRAQVPHGDELPAGTARMAVAGIAGIVFEEVVAGRTEQLPALLPDLLYSALVPYVGHEAALAELRETPAE